MPALARKQSDTDITQTLNTLVLRDALAALSLYQKKIHILDLGVLYPDSLQFFNQYHCKLTVANAIDTLCAFTYAKVSSTRQAKLAKKTAAKNAVTRTASTEDISHTRKLIDKLFNDIIPANHTFDLVLGWDSLNYMQSEDRRELIHFLSKYTHTHSLLHTFITTSQYICAQPAKFIIHKSDNVSYFEKGEKIEHHPFTRYQMQKEFPGLSVTKAILMRNGLQEIAFRFKQ